MNGSFHSCSTIWNKQESLSNYKSLAGTQIKRHHVTRDISMSHITSNLTKSGFVQRNLPKFSQTESASSPRFIPRFSEMCIYRFPHDELSRDMVWLAMCWNACIQHVRNGRIHECSTFGVSTPVQLPDPWSASSTHLVGCLDLTILLHPPAC